MSSQELWKFFRDCKLSANVISALPFEVAEVYVDVARRLESIDAPVVKPVAPSGRSRNSDVGVPGESGIGALA